MEWLRLAYQRIPLWVRQRVDREINIEVRPVQVMRTWELNASDLSNRCVFEPGKVLERYEQFLFTNE